MMTMLMGVGVAMTPILMIAALLGLAEWRDRKRVARYARQIELTDAIHRELGAVAAPVVEESASGGGWLVKLTVPFDQPALVTALVRITDRVFGRRKAPGTRPVRIILTPAPPALDGTARPVTRRPLGRRVSAIPALR